MIRPESAVIDQFHKLYYGSDSRTWRNTYWLGIRTYKCPLDLWVYQELMAQIRPTVIIETGTASGGSALFMASMMDLLGAGRVITIDAAMSDHYVPKESQRPHHERITYIHGSSVEPDVVQLVSSMVGLGDRVMVVLDSDHEMNHVLREMEIYGELVSRGSFLIVEDTNINGHPVMPSFGPGPMEAVDAFLHRYDGFVIDPDQEKFFLTMNPRGYLKKVDQMRNATSR